MANQSEDGVVPQHVPPALMDIHGAGHLPYVDDDAKANVLVFTMQDCPIANSYIPMLNKLVDEYEPRGIRLVVVHVDPQLSDGEARKHAADYQIKARVVIDRQHAWVDQIGATKSPQAALLSPAGQLVYSGRIDDRYAGLGKRRSHVTAHDLRDAIDAVLAGRPVPRSKTEAVGCFIPRLPIGE